ncbi:MAG: type II secretion system F family protein [Dissulfurispiraceae bacterium]
MPTTFKWTGKTPKGTVQQGELSAETREDVIAALRRQGIIPTIIAEKKAPAIQMGGFSSRPKKIKDRDIIVFTRQFASMYNAGIPIVQGLDIMSKQTENKTLRAIIGQVKSDVEGGVTMAEALKKHPKAFNELYVNLVGAGEMGGVLDSVLQRLAVYIEKAMKLKKKVKGAMIYPTVVMFIAALVVAIIMIFVIPVFAKVFSEMGAALPLPTQLVIGFSNFLSGLGGLIVFFAIVGFIVGFRMYRKTPAGHMNTDRLFLKIPIIGNLIRKVAVARFSRTLGTLISSGVPILDAHEICAKSAGNKVVEKVVFEVKREVASGKTVSEPLAKSDVFPPMVVQMISVGESTGALDQMLSKISDFYDDEVDNSVQNLTVLLEPLLMVFLGTVIGFIVVSLYLPIFKLGAVVSGTH